MPTQNGNGVSWLINGIWQRNPKQITIMTFLLAIESLMASLTVFSLIPLANFLLDSELKSPSNITIYLNNVLSTLHVKPSFFIYASVFLISNLAKAILDILVRIFVIKTKYTIVKDIYVNVLRSIMNARLGFFQQFNHGELLNSISKEVSSISDAIASFSIGISQLLQLLVFLVLPVVLNPMLAMGTILLSGIFALPFFAVYRKTYELGKQNLDSGNYQMGLLSETLNLARLIIAFGRQEYSIDKFIDSYDHHSKITQKLQFITNAVPIAYRPLGFTACMISLGVAISSGANLGEIAATIWSLLAALPLVVSLFQNSVQLKNIVPSIEQVYNLKKSADSMKEQSGNSLLDIRDGKIYFEKISFTYPNREPLISDFSLDISGNQVTGIAGQSGSGKSTIMDLILGLQVPTRGRILIDVQDIQKININEFRNKIGYVSQEPLLFSGSIRDNMIWSNPYASETDIWSALAQANADVFIRRIPGGLDAEVGDKGSSLSGGQRQRIALARALVRKPKILILDEATSALDTESEYSIQQAIYKLKGITIILIAHRLSTIKSADKILVIENGHIIECGTYTELNNNGGFFTKMIALSEKVNLSDVAS